MTVWLALEPSTRRRCYGHLPEFAWFKLPLDSTEFLCDPHATGKQVSPQNWNESGGAVHPLRDVHMGYLAHAFLRQVPWQLIGRVRSIEADVEIRALRTFRGNPGSRVVAT
jgi:hypothetical protein